MDQTGISLPASSHKVPIAESVLTQLTESYAIIGTGFNLTPGGFSPMKRLATTTNTKEQRGDRRPIRMFNNPSFTIEQTPSLDWPQL